MCIVALAIDGPRGFLTPAATLSQGRCMPPVQEADPGH